MVIMVAMTIKVAMVIRTDRIDMTDRTDSTDWKERTERTDRAVKIDIQRFNSQDSHLNLTFQVTCVRQLLQFLRCFLCRLIFVLPVSTTELLVETMVVSRVFDLRPTTNLGW